MDMHDLDVIISKYTENVLYFTNVWPITGWGISFTFRDGTSILYLPDSEMDFTSRATTGDIRPYGDTSLDGVKAIILQMDLDGKKIGLELSKEGIASSHLGYEVAFPNMPTFDLIKKTCNGSTFTDATRIIDEMRACKTNLDLKQLRLVNDLNYYGLEVASELLHVEGFTEMQVATECEKTIMERVRDVDKVDFIRSYAFVMAGPNGIKASRPYNISTAYRCKKGEYVMLELNTQVNGFWSDLTRTWVCGRRPTQEQREHETAVNGAIEAAFNVMKPGNSWLGAYQASRKHIESCKLGQYHTPFLGHGIGVKLHEQAPMMHDKVDPSKKFEVGHYCSVEPGLYFKNTGALRFERDVAITTQGVEIFDEFPCSL